MNVAVEDKTHQLAIFVYHRAPGVAADNVGGADVIEPGTASHRHLCVRPAVGQTERRIAGNPREQL